MLMGWVLSELAVEGNYSGVKYTELLYAETKTGVTDGSKKGHLLWPGCKYILQ